MIEVDIPESLFEEQGRQLYGAKLLEIQVRNVKQNIIFFYGVTIFPFLKVQYMTYFIFFFHPHFSTWHLMAFNDLLWQAKVKLNEEQLATLSSPKAVQEYLEKNRENITTVIKQNLAVGDIFKRENLQASTSLLVPPLEVYLFIYLL